MIQNSPYLNSAPGTEKAWMNWPCHRFYPFPPISTWGQKRWGWEWGEKNHLLSLHWHQQHSSRMTRSDWQRVPLELSQQSLGKKRHLGDVPARPMWCRGGIASSQCQWGSPGCHSLSKMESATRKEKARGVEKQKRSQMALRCTKLVHDIFHFSPKSHKLSCPH